MFRNRISRIFVEAVASPSREASFASLPAYALAGGATLDVYRLAYEQAQQQVAERRERRDRAHEWN